MKISPVSAQGLTVGAIQTGAEAPQTMTQKIRSLRMPTNATPGRVEAPLPVEELPIPDVVDEAQAVNEATQPLSPQLAAIARAKRALQVKEREIAAREEALKTQAPAQGGGVDMTKLKADPLGVLLEAGVTYDQLTEAVLNQGNFNPEVKELRDKLKALEESFESKLSDRDAQSETAALAEMQREAISLSAQGEDFELIRETKNIPAVMDLIKRTYKQTGEVLDVRDALKLVEDELYKDITKLTALKKVQSVAPAQTAPQPMQQHRQMRTLTNRDTASVPMSRKARALAAFAGTLKQ